MSRAKVRRMPPDAATRRQIRDALRCWSCAAEPKLAFTPKRGLEATVAHLPGCSAVPGEHRAAGRTTCVIREPELLQVTGTGAPDA